MENCIKLKNVIRYFCFFLTTLFFSCSESQTREKENLRIAVAASFLTSFEKIAPIFEKKYGIKISLIGASSGQIVAQMKNGASFDVLVLADSSYNLALLVDKKMPFKAVSKGKLAIFSKKEFTDTQALREYMRGHESLKIAMPNPTTAPYGRLAEKWLQVEKIKFGQFIYAESAAAVLVYLKSGAVDLAITSAAFQYQKSTDYYAYPIDKSPFLTSYAFLAQEKKAAARMFFDFLDEKESKMILKKHRFE